MAKQSKSYREHEIGISVDHKSGRSGEQIAYERSRHRLLHDTLQNYTRGEAFASASETAVFCDRDAFWVPKFERNVFVNLLHPRLPLSQVGTGATRMSVPLPPVQLAFDWKARAHQEQQQSGSSIGTSH